MYVKEWCDSVKALFEETRAIEEIPAKELKKSENGNHLFSGAVLNKCTIVVGQQSPPLSLPKQCMVIDSDEDD